MESKYYQTFQCVDYEKKRCSLKVHENLSWEETFINHKDKQHIPNCDPDFSF
jgi:hypothetical protein